MPACAVQGCLSYSRKTKGTDIKYYSFPNNKGLSKQWVRACHRSDKFCVKQARICSKHFSKSCYRSSLKHELLQYCPKNYRDLKMDAVPTECLPVIAKGGNSNVAHERQQRSQAKNNKKNRRNIVKSLLVEPVNELPVPADTNHTSSEKSVHDVGELQKKSDNNSKLVAELKKENSALKKQNKALEEECNILKKKIALLEEKNESLTTQNRNLHLDKSKC